MAEGRSMMRFWRGWAACASLWCLTDALRGDRVAGNLAWLVFNLAAIAAITWMIRTEESGK